MAETHPRLTCACAQAELARRRRRATKDSTRKPLLNDGIQTVAGATFAVFGAGASLSRRYRPRETADATAPDAPPVFDRRVWVARGRGTNPRSTSGRGSERRTANQENDADGCSLYRKWPPSDLAQLNRRQLLGFSNAPELRKGSRNIADFVKSYLHRAT
jgi:hypothetical protein